MRGRRAGRLVLGLALLAGVAEVWLARRTAGPGGILEQRWDLLVEVGAWWAAFAVAAACVLRLPARTAVLLLGVLAVAVRVAALSPKAPLSDDLYRYVWDGTVQLSGTDPYRHPPVAAQLRDLRTPYLWPEDEDGDRTLINRPTVRTIYPPVAQAWFTVLRLALPFDVPDLAYEVVGLALDLAVLAVLLALLRASGRDVRWAALYALAPLPALESVQNAHVDVLAVLLVLAALELVRRRRLHLAPAALAAATLVKVYPAVLLPLLVRRPRPVRPVAVFLGLAVLSYLPHVLAVGTDVLGYLPGYLEEERYSEGSRYALVGLLGLTGTAASAAVAGALAVASLWALRTRLPAPDAALRLFTVVLLLVTPVQPWYALLLVALASLCGSWQVLPLAAAPYAVYFAAVLDADVLAAGRLAYGAAAVATAAALLASRRRAGARPGTGRPMPWAPPRR